ncbi:unnamed protein product [Closterium sp. NIES-54]
MMLFGLTNASATIQMTMNEAFPPLLDKCVIVYRDEILVYSRDKHKNIAKLVVVFKILDKHQLLTKGLKCEFFQDMLEFMGHVISESGVEIVNGSKVLAPPSLGQRRRPGRVNGNSSQPSAIGELLDTFRRAAGDRCGVAVDQGARQLQLTGLGDRWVVDQEGLFDREVDEAVRRPEK